MYEIVQGLALEGIVRHPGLVAAVHRLPVIGVCGTGSISPTALQHGGAVVSRIFDCAHLVEHGASLDAGEYLAAHYTHARIAAVASGYGADTQAIVVSGGNHARNVAAVTAVVDVVSGNDGSAEGEIVAIYVSGVAVAVVVLAGTPYLILIHPHCILEVGMGVIDALVEHCNYYGRVAGTEFPGLLNIHVSSRGELALTEIAAVHEMPLVREEFVIPVPGGDGSCGRLRDMERHGLARICLLEPAVAVHGADFAQTGELHIYLLHRGVLIEADAVPEMETFTAAELLAAHIQREDPLYAVVADYGEHLLHGWYLAGSQHIGRSALGEAGFFEQSCNALVEAHEQLTPDHVLPEDGKLRLGFRGLGLNPAAGKESAADKSAKTGKYQRISDFHLLLVVGIILLIDILLVIVVEIGRGIGEAADIAFLVLALLREYKGVRHP